MGEDRLVSFIIPALNEGATIERCLKSIRDQDHPADKIEIIVVDNGSRDNTLEIAKRFTQKIFSDPAATIARLRNIGAGNAKGDLLVFIDSDCVIPKDGLRIALSHFSDDSVCLVGARSYRLADDAGWIDRAWTLHLTSGKGGKEASQVASMIMLIKKEIFIKAGGFDESLVTCEDVDFCYRVKKIGKIVSDERFAPIHLDVIKSLPVFFRKEVWRGQDNLRVTFRHIRTPKELRSLLWLLYYAALSALLLPAAAAAFILKDMKYALVIIAGLVLPIAIVVIDTCLKTGKFEYFGKLFLLYSVYTAARIKALLVWKRR
jgi:glycosyltransferase involved in cell wall biosynthesis